MSTPTGRWIAMEKLKWTPHCNPHTLEPTHLTVWKSPARVSLQGVQIAKWHGKKRGKCAFAPSYNDNSSPIQGRCRSFGHLAWY
ncbi:unnamed protein product [Periconia digitata]|uniref:Uncharacterized protein n=1 Tax=Periconia digitata TaxID=1303443 RepID=A0A9W4XKB0_9PLEO|nr:unnamed protein product [Periconia digitata]